MGWGGGGNGASTVKQSPKRNNWSIQTQNHLTQGSNFSDVWKIDGFAPEANASLLAAKF